jgi:hypothetical protein
MADPTLADALMGRLQGAWDARPWKNIDVVNPDKSAMANGLLTAASFLGPGVKMPMRTLAAEGRSGGAMSLQDLMAQKPQRPTSAAEDIRHLAGSEARGQPAMTPEMLARRAAMQAEADRLRGLAEQKMTPGPSGGSTMSFEDMMAEAARKRGQ